MHFLNNFARPGRFTALISGCVALSAISTAPAFAVTDGAIPQAAFSVRGVDFTSPRAVTRLHRKLVGVATAMCVRNASGIQPMGADERVCYATALADGRAQIAGRAQQALRERAVRLASSAGDTDLPR